MEQTSGQQNVATVLCAEITGLSALSAHLDSEKYGYFDERMF
ncbi:MAG: hypothetical protein R2764_04130 [Bacteroidales bacterium]